MNANRKRMASDRKGLPAISRRFAWPQAPRTILLLSHLLAAAALWPQSGEAVTRTVTILSDSGPNSLRQLIADSASGDTITFSVTGTILLTSTLVIDRDLTIVGPASPGIVVSGNHSSRVLQVEAGAVNISGLTIADGHTGIYGYGAGIWIDWNGRLTLDRCTVSGNVSGDSGGGVANNGTLVASNCTFSGNQADNGGGIYTYGGAVFLRNCTVVSNTVPYTPGAGGGVFNYSLQPGTSGDISGTIIADNSAASHDDVIGVFTSSGYNLIGKIDYRTATDDGAAGVPTSGFTNSANHDLVGSLASPINASLGPLQDNGGPTLTHALLPGSPAVNAGDPNFIPPPDFDQRGAGFPRVLGGRIDIGAFESEALDSISPIFTTLYTFTGGNDGANPQAGLILSGNTLYGTAINGGSSGNGTVFAVNTSGTGFTTLHTFTGGDGYFPVAGLILSGNTLYGTAGLGGGSGNGTVFAVNTNGTGFTTLHAFTGGDGYYPLAGLILSGNTLYGTAVYGGSSGNGTVFALSTDGTDFRTLHSFTGSSDGAEPVGGLVLSGDTLYGTAYGGGSSGSGTVFKVNTDGTSFTNLHTFTGGSDGAYPRAGLITNSSGKTLYGTTQYGGSSGWGAVFAVNTDGTGFTNLHSFALSDGGAPEAGLILSGDTLYGVADAGGSAGNGAVFVAHTDGTGFATLHSFTGGSDGGRPYAGLILSSNTLYGTAGDGGSSGHGTVFSLSLPALPPVARCKHVTVSADAGCSANASIDDGSFSSNAGDTITLVQSPPGPYPLGVTSVTLTVIDSHGASNSCLATVTVLDTTPPVITCPGYIFTDATSPAGAVVSFAPTASDNCTLASITSSPSSGTTFPIGDKTVACTATDAAGNLAACTFTVHVKGAAEQIGGLITRVQSLGLPGTGNSLVVKLQGAASALDRGNLQAACGNLGAFVNEVNTQTAKKLSAAQGGLLNAEAARIRAVLGCS